MPLQEFKHNLFYFAKEKRRRVEANAKQDTAVFPFIRISDEAIETLSFYKETIRPIIVERLPNRTEHEESENEKAKMNKFVPFFIHTLTGKPIDPKSITKSLQYFGSEWKVLEHSNINYNARTEQQKKDLLTSASFRRCYATGQFQLFQDSQKEKEVTRDMLDDFLRKLATSMNTSPYMLKITYIIDPRVLIGDVHEPLRLENGHEKLLFDENSSSMYDLELNDCD